MRVTRPSSLFPRLPVRTGLLLLAVLGGLVMALHWTIIAPLKAAITCQEDWEAIIATIESGGGSYEGACAFYGAPEGLGTTVPGPLRDELRRAQAEVQTLATYWTGPATPRRVASVAGGLPLIVTVLVLAAVTVASEVKAGTAAWLLSNGWTRKRYLLEKSVSLAIASAVALMLAMALEAALIARDVDGRVGLEASAWGWDLVRVGASAWLGTWIYAALGMLIGLGLGNPDTAILVSALVLGVDTLVLSPLTDTVWSPASTVAVILRGGDPSAPASWVPAPADLTWTQGLLWAGAWFILLAGSVTAIILFRRFQARPARPA